MTCTYLKTAAHTAKSDVGDLRDTAADILDDIADRGEAVRKIMRPN